MKVAENDVNSSRVISKDGSALSHRQLKEFVLKSMTLEEIEQIKMEAMKRQQNPKVLEEVASKVSEKIVSSSNETGKKDEKRA